jgi:hypothetical protein
MRKRLNMILSLASRWNLRLADWPPLRADENKIHKAAHRTSYLMSHGLGNPEVCSLDCFYIAKIIVVSLAWKFEDLCSCSNGLRIQEGQALMRQRLTNAPLGYSPYKPLKPYPHGCC